jgi:hypothetical protein
MKFRQRLVRYLIGVSIGLVLVAVLFGDRAWNSWTPNSKVLEFMRDNYQEPDSTVTCHMKCFDLSGRELQDLMENGDVEFNESLVKQEPKIYVIDHEDDNRVEYSIKLELKEISLDKREARIIDIDFPGKEDCPC